MALASHGQTLDLPSPEQGGSLRSEAHTTQYVPYSSIVVFRFSFFLSFFFRGANLNQVMGKRYLADILET